jgi:glutamyl-tRNA synthetase
MFSAHWRTGDHDGLRWLGLDCMKGPDVGGLCAIARRTPRDLSITAKLLVEKMPAHVFARRSGGAGAAGTAKRKETRIMTALPRLALAEAARRAGRVMIRFRMPYEGTTTAHDHLRGDILTENNQLNDHVLLKSDGLPTYHLAALVDDHEMGITHVLRGSEWLGTFPLHVNIVRAFGWEEPVWIHLSLFLKPSGKGKMSKRESAEAIKDDHSIFIKDLRGLGFTPEGVLNWSALMGWGVAEDDVMTIYQMVERFSIDGLTPSPAAINFQRLDHFNATHIRLLSTEDLAADIYTRLG